MAASSDWPQSRKEKEIRLVNLFQYGLAASEAQRRSLGSQLARLQSHVTHQTSLRAYTPLPPPRGRSTGQTPPPLQRRTTAPRSGTPPLRPVTMPPLWRASIPGRATRSATPPPSPWMSLSPRSATPPRRHFAMMPPQSHRMASSPYSSQELQASAQAWPLQNGSRWTVFAMILVLFVAAVTIAIRPQPQDRVSLSDAAIALLAVDASSFEMERIPYRFVPLMGTGLSILSQYGTSSATSHQLHKDRDIDLFETSSGSEVSEAGFGMAGTVNVASTTSTDQTSSSMAKESDLDHVSHATSSSGTGIPLGRGYENMDTINAEAEGISAVTASSFSIFHGDDVTVSASDAMRNGLGLESASIVGDISSTLSDSEAIMPRDSSDMTKHMQNPEDTGGLQPLMVILICFFLVTCLLAAAHCGVAAEHVRLAAAPGLAVAASVHADAEAFVDASASPQALEEQELERAESPQTPRNPRERRPWPRAVLAPIFDSNEQHDLAETCVQTCVESPQAVLKKPRRGRAATPEPPQTYKVRKMYLASVGKKDIDLIEEGPRPYPFKSPRLREEAEREVVRMVVAAAEAEEAAMGNRRRGRITKHGASGGA